MKVMNLHFEFQKLTKHLKTRLATASAFSLAAEESTDIAQLCIWVRFRNFWGYKRFVGNEIACFTKYTLDIFAPCSFMKQRHEHAVFTTSDGVSSMTRKHKVLVSEMWKISQLSGISLYIAPARTMQQFNWCTSWRLWTQWSTLFKC